MIFKKRNPDRPSAETPDERAAPASPPPEAATSDEPIPAEHALDFIAELLRTYAEYAFDIGNRSAKEIEDLFETWARHLLIGVPPPARQSTEDEAPESTGGRRDLPGLRLAFREQRKLEQGYVTTSLSAFREAAWAFISGLRRSLTAEQASDRRIGHRMRRLESAVRGGDADRIKDEAQETVNLLAEFLTERGSRQQAEVMEMAARLESLRDELDNVRAQAAIDPMTELYNRAAFDEQIEREVDLATLFGRHACLIMIDVDHFKWVNDTHGHPCGDEVLRQFASTLSRCFMRRDDFLARYGGEEFVVVLRDLEVSVAQGLADRAMNAIRNLEVSYDGLEEPIRLTASMGLARLRTGETAPSWLERADRALYQAKDLGRDRIEVDPIDLEET